VFRSLLVVLAACGGTQDTTTPPPPPLRPTPIDAAVATPAPIDAPLARALDDNDCKALSGAPALAIAVVTTSKPDCSSVGHLRIALEVKKLVRGDGITTVTASGPLYGPRGPRLAVGETVIVAIDPGTHPAETVYCVPLPAREGTGRHLVRLDDPGNADRAIAQIEAGCPH
jgi:hypothetical protein